MFGRKRNVMRAPRCRDAKARMAVFKDRPKNVYAETGHKMHYINGLRYVTLCHAQKRERMVVKYAPNASFVT